MSQVHAALHGVMEGKGEYNKHAKLPAGGAALAIPLLEEAARRVELATSEQPVVIADYGSSQGRNSMVPMQVAIRNLQQRLISDRPICVFHVDQPSNDFNTLFGVLDGPDSYLMDEPNVFPAAIGRSFYKAVLPPSSVHLGWYSYAAVWLSRAPALIPGHLLALRSTGKVREEFERQGARDWEKFLLLRAQELRSGGRLVVVLPGLADDGLSGFENIMDHANAALAEMVADGTLATEERARMVLTAYPRRRGDLLDPFSREGHFESLTVEDFDMSVLPDAAWTDYERDGDKEALATKHARFFRSIFMPSLGSALERVRAGDIDALRIFGERLEARMTRRLADRPVAMNSFVQTIVLAKRV